MKLLSSLPSIKTKSKKRVGRGYGSGKGSHTVGRGQKGQKSRNSVPLWFEGGQLPLIKRLPMLRGKGRLKSLSKVETVSLDVINKLAHTEITAELLKQLKLVHRSTPEIKILAGKIERKITVIGLKVSAGAQKAIEAAGGVLK